MISKYALALMRDAVVPYLGQTMTPEVAAHIVSSVATACYPGPVDTGAILPEHIGPYIIACEHMASVQGELRELHREQWEELERHRHGIAFNPDYQSVVDAENQGRVLLVVARTEDTDEPVGNYMVTLESSAATSDLSATEEFVYVSAGHRHGRLGLTLIRYTERALARLGVREFHVGSKNLNSYGKLLERLGYQEIGRQYFKILKE